MAAASRTTGPPAKRPERETAMATHHPVHDLCANLEAARLEAVEALASSGSAFSLDALRDLATLQLVLTAVREEIDAHGARLGWGGDQALD